MGISFNENSCRKAFNNRRLNPTNVSLKDEKNEFLKMPVEKCFESKCLELNQRKTTLSGTLSFVW